MSVTQLQKVYHHDDATTRQNQEKIYSESVNEYLLSKNLISKYVLISTPLLFSTGINVIEIIDDTAARYPKTNVVKDWIQKTREKNQFYKVQLSVISSDIDFDIDRRTIDQAKKVMRSKNQNSARDSIQ